MIRLKSVKIVCIDIAVQIAMYSQIIRTIYIPVHLSVITIPMSDFGRVRKGILKSMNGKTK